MLTRSCRIGQYRTRLLRPANHTCKANSFREAAVRKGLPEMRKRQIAILAELSDDERTTLLHILGKLEDVAVLRRFPKDKKQKPR